MGKRDYKRPKVGIGVIVLKRGKILLHKRKNSGGNGTWAFPGGHLEFNETIEACAKREAMEEAGIKIKNLRYGPYTNDINKKENTHYITLFVIAEYQSGKVEVREPGRCERWEWFSWNNLPSPLFLPLKNLLKQNFNPFSKDN